MARMLFQAGGHTHIPTPSLRIPIPVPPSSAPVGEGQGSGWDHMLGTEGLQVFVTAGVAVDEGVVEREVRAAVREELCQQIRSLTGKEGCSTDHSDR